MNSPHIMHSDATNSSSLAWQDKKGGIKKKKKKEKENNKYLIGSYIGGLSHK